MQGVNTIQPLLDADLQFVFVGGKGGVGKTTSSCALSIQMALKKMGSKVLLISTDPAHNLSDAFNQEFTSVPTPVVGCDVLDAAGAKLDCIEIDPAAVMEREFGEIVDGLQDEMITDFRQWLTSVPGIDEAMALSQALRYIDDDEYSCLVFDTAPTGHTLRLLQLPQVIKAGIDKLQSWQARLGGVLGAIAGAFSKDSDKAAQAKSLTRLKEKLVEYQGEIERIAAMFRNRERTNFVCVCIAEHLSVFETARLIRELRDQSIESSLVLVNQLVPRSFVSMAATQSSGKSRPPLSSLTSALQQLGLSEGVVSAAQEACELCGARASIQKKYLEQLSEALGSTHGIVRLPLLPKEVRGANEIASFSRHMLEANPKLQDDASLDMPTDNATLQQSQQQMIASLTSLLNQSAGQGAGDEVESAVAVETAAAAPPAAAPQNPMMLLMSLQNVLSQPDGLNRLLAHPEVVSLRKSNSDFNSFCTTVETSGPMGALAHLGNQALMVVLQELLPVVMASLNDPAPTSSEAGAATAASDDLLDAELDDMYD